MNRLFLEEAANFVLARAGFAPEIGVILGSCLGPFADTIRDRVEIPYETIPHFLRSTAPDHAGILVLGTVGGKRVACLSGRFHRYEGYDYEQLTLPIRFLKQLGVRQTIVTNISGAINPAYRPGDVVVMRDHIKLFGDSPLIGPNDEMFGPRCPTMRSVYAPSLRNLALALAPASGLTVHEGVYFFFPGPQFETASEIAAARILGGDLAGMSTVPEVITAAHCGMPILGLSVVVNMAEGVAETPITGAEINAVIERTTGPFSNYLGKIIERMED
ncbi:MAG: purine-nucleoside phosphorylase [Clostridia bacterium]|nr:purine-nucleoside phosphorylase [Clostridia bacterium]